MRCLEICTWSCPEGIRKRGQKVVREVRPEDNGWGVTRLEDTAETMLTGAIPQTEHVDEKRNSQTKLLKELRKSQQPTQMTQAGILLSDPQAATGGNHGWR